MLRKKLQMPAPPWKKRPFPGPRNHVHSVWDLPDEKCRLPASTPVHQLRAAADHPTTAGSVSVTADSNNLRKACTILIVSQLGSHDGFVTSHRTDGLGGSCGTSCAPLYLRDRIAKAHGKTVAQVQARFAAILQFRSTLQYCIPGVLTIVFGIFWVLDRSRQHESDWWIGLLFIPAGWLLILLLARRSWRRYLELQQIAEKGQTDATGIGSTPPKIG